MLTNTDYPTLGASVARMDTTVAAEQARIIGIVKAHEPSADNWGLMFCEGCDWEEDGTVYSDHLADLITRDAP